MSTRKRATVRCWIVDSVCTRYGSLIDVSVGGARVATTMPPPLGDRLELRFCLAPEGEAANREAACEAAAEISVEAEVVWRSAGVRGRGGVMGVSFMDAIGSEVIAEYVSTDR